MAQKADTFANHQISLGVKRPKLAIVVGVMHVGLLKALEMPAEDRISQIIGDPVTPRYFQPRLLEEGYLARYNPRRAEWTASVFKEPRLRLR